MNICFISGKIVSKIEFKFIIKNDEKNKCRHRSICYFFVELENKTVVKIKSYDKIADLCYRKLKEEEYVVLYGRLMGDMNIELSYIKL